jgi:hypothetical protein
LTSKDSLDIDALIKFRAKKNIFTKFAILYPGLLITVAGRAMNSYWVGRRKVSFEEDVLKRSQLAILKSTILISNFPNNLVGKINHFSNHSV